MVIASPSRLRYPRRRRPPLTHGATLLLLLARPAYAGNEDEILLGNDAALMGGAITATTADGSALWYNPAGLAASRLDAVDVSANAFTARWVRIDRYCR